MNDKFWITGWLGRRGPALTMLAGALFLILIATLRHGSGQAPGSLDTVGKIQAISVPENGQGVNNGYPSIARDGEGNLWCAFMTSRLEHPDQPYNVHQYQEGDSIALRERQNGQWLDPVILNTNFGVNLEPVVAASGDGNIYVVWTSRRNGEFGLYSRRSGPDRVLGSELRIPTSGRLNGRPSLVADRTGRLWLAAESYRNTGMDIALYALEDSGWRQMPDAAATGDPEFRPRLAAAPDGSIWCAWDTDSEGKYRVMVRRFDPSAARWGPPQNVPGDGKLDSYAPDLAIDHAGRVWVTYARNECEEAVWGLRGPKAGQAPRPTVRLVALDRGKWKYPSTLTGNSHGYVARGDIPRIAVDNDGTVWVSWQFLPGHVNGKIGSIVCERERWSRPEIFGMDEAAPVEAQHRYDQKPSIVADQAGHLLIAYERGEGVFKNRDIYLREIQSKQMAAGPADPPLATFAEEELRSVSRPVTRHAPREAIHDGSGGRWQLYFGDLHNHLLIDDGHMGSVDQLFMFHRDRFDSDFGATTSHGDSNKLMISELALNDRLTDAMLSPGQFVSIPGFEWTQGDFVVPRAGHRSVIFPATGGRLYRPTEGYSDSIREFEDLMSKTPGLIWAHHVSRASAGGTDWSCVNPKVEPVVEMCSSWGRFEYYQNPGHIRVPELKNSSVQDAWRMGWHLGLVGGSDGHNLYGDRIQGLTGVYAASLTRAAIFDAIRHRRCYATTGEHIVVEFQVNGHMMGSEIAANDGPLIEGNVTGTAPLISVEIVKFEGGSSPFRTVYRAPVNGERSQIWWKDPAFRGDSLYYLRVAQQVSPELAARYANAKDDPFPSEMAWSSPVWVKKTD